MPTSTDQLDAELRARRQAGGSPLKTVGMFGESARCRLCRYRHNRHTFATRFAEATAGDVVALAAILGHANLRTVMRYVHVSREHRRTQMTRFVEAEKNRVKSGPNDSAEIGKSGQTSANESLPANHTIN